ncbi:MAG: peptidyl-prolyl cis-trans isomerase, peptidylprolyl isomerase [Flavipsychrobacter sp.]|nr:peptidyl-prolyl cis-trans isomerase, peptidylprolyl isomerase [Flavipsychrobacter sp.]
MQGTIKTNKGDIVINFFEDQTPNTVNNFKKLAGEGFYDGVKFHRIIRNFMIQGGDPLTKEEAKKHMWGTGGPGYKFDDEIGPANSNTAGSISMANAGRNTNGSQFFINLADNHFLNPKHTAFGQVVKGMDVVAAIGDVPTGPSDQPVDPVVIESVVFE